jgi:type IV pilus assembly protein PilA
MEKGIHMLRKLRERVQNEQGFTLIELLVVILIIGILAAIALPSFINQRSKATDAQAKSNARTAQEAMETYYTDNQTYVGADATALQTIEPALNNTPAPVVTTAAANNYALTTTSTSSTPVTFTITRATTGVVTRTCSPVSNGGCPASGNW